MEETIMADKAYEYMDWPRIEAIVYGEEASPRDVMQPRVTEDGVLIQGFFPGADAAEVVVGEKSYPMILELRIRSASTSSFVSIISAPGLR